MPPGDAEDDVDWALEKQAAEPEGHRRMIDGALLGDRSGTNRIVAEKIKSG